MGREVQVHRRLLLLLVSLLVAGMVLAFSLGGCGGDGRVPNVVIDAPPSNSEVTLGETIAIQSTATDATGVIKMELWVDDILYTSDISPIAEGQSPFSVAQDWTPRALGQHSVVVKAYSGAGNMGESAPITLIAVSEPSATPTVTESVGPPPSVTPTEPGLTPTQPSATPTVPPPTHAPPPTHTPMAGPCLPSVMTTIPVGGHPKGIAAFGRLVYVGIHDAPVVVAIDADTNTVLTRLDTHASGPKYANGVAFHDGLERIYVANRDAGNVSSISVSDPSDWKVIPTGPLPFGIATTGLYVYVANFGNNTIGRIEVSSDSYLGSIPNISEPALLTALWDDVIVPTNGAGPVYHIPPSGDLIPVSPDQEGYFAAAMYTSDLIFVTNRKTDEVTKINVNTRSVEDIVRMPHTPYGIVGNSRTDHVFVVAAGANLLYVLDADTLQILGTVPVAAQDGTEGGQGIAVLWDRIYVSNYQNGTVTVLDDSACEEIGPVAEQIKQAFADKYDRPAREFHVYVAKSTDTHAQGTVSFYGESYGGGWWLGFKEPTGWILVADGNGPILCGDIEPYDFPVDMVPECWDEATNTLVIR